MSNDSKVGKKRRCAIVGSGASGLTTTKWAVEYGFEPIVFERDESLGGLWRYKPHDTDLGTVMRSTTINTSKEMTSYSDFPPAKELPNYMHNTVLLRYLEDYTRHFDLYKYIKFKHTVTAIKRSKNYDKTGEWTVEYLDQITGKCFVEQFECVLLCIGHHTTPNMPEPGKLWPGFSNSTCRLIHSHSYKNYVGYEDKTVVVVGIGNSAIDVAVELSNIAKKVYLSTRRGAWILNRVGRYGYPMDMIYSTRFNAILTKILPLKVIEWIWTRKIEERMNHYNFGLKPNHTFCSQHPSINDELPNRIISGRVVIKPDIREIYDSNTVVFENGTVAENVDEIIMSTGFKFDYKLVEDGKLIPVKDNDTPLFKYMFPAQLMDHNTLPSSPVGSVIPISEMMARVFFEQITGGIKLPSEQEMLDDIEKKRMSLERRYVKSPRHRLQIDYVAFMDELADMIGAKPRILPRLFTNPILAHKLLFEANCSYVYRLDGPHHWPKALEAIMGVRERAESAQRTRLPSTLPKKNDVSVCFYSFIAIVILYFITKLMQII